MSVIEGSSVSVKTMSDGTLRLSIDIEPRNAQAAFALFGAPGRAVALAALVDGYASASDTSPERVAGTTKQEHKGGEWAKLAGIWCADPDFWKFLNYERGFAGRADGAHAAAVCLRELCGIQSRAELDNDLDALARFNTEVRHPFMKYMQARGLRK